MIFSLNDGCAFIKGEVNGKKKNKVKFFNGSVYYRIHRIYHF